MTSEQDPRRGDAGGVTGPEPLPGMPSYLSGDASVTQPEPTDPTDPPEPPEPTRQMGRVSYQDENTVAREPTLAEQRAHQQAQRKAIEDEEARLAEEARQKKVRKRVLIGGGAAAGIAALIAIGYASSGDDEEVEARCVDENNVVVDDSNCVQPAANSQASSGYGGVGFFPLFIGGGGRQYHYNYGGSGGIGQTATGGTATVPKDATVKSATSGRVIQRGGFGVSKATGTSSGSKSGGSSSGS